MPTVVSIVIPSRLAPVREENPQALWLERAIESIHRQTVSTNAQIEIIVGIDHGTAPPENSFYGQDWIFFAITPASENGQAAAINAAAAEAQGEYLAILEDDDRWRPNFLEHGLRAIAEYDFVSSNQLETPPGGKGGHINDFPTPSGWFMGRALWDEIGGMDASYRYHLDNDWLGRLSDAGKRRLHLVEAAAPQEAEELRRKRPLLSNYLNAKPGFNFLARHDEKTPLVMRTANPQGGMATIHASAEAGLRSREEYARLQAVYGRIPC